MLPYVLCSLYLSSQSAGNHTAFECVADGNSKWATLALADDLNRNGQKVTVGLRLCIEILANPLLALDVNYRYMRSHAMLQGRSSNRCALQLQGGSQRSQVT